MNVKKVIAIIIAIVILAINIAIIKDNFQNFTKEKLYQFSLPKSGINESVLSDGDSSSKIAVISIDGTIIADQKHYHLLDSLEAIRDDYDIKGVILEVDSPGGGVYESAQISDKIKQIKAENKIPFYTVMGSVAASGGYYVAAVTDKIYAMPETTTGSIGVILSSTNFSGLFEKYGVSTNIIKSGEFKDMGSSTKPMSEQDRAILQKIIDNSYNRFVNVVAEGRKMSTDTVKIIADGRVYDGQQALELGLIDEFGYYEKALSDLGKELNIENPQVIRYEYKEDFNSLISLLGANYLNMNKSEIQKSIEAIQNIQTGQQNRPMYLYGGM